MYVGAQNHLSVAPTSLMWPGMIMKVTIELVADRKCDFVMVIDRDQVSEWTSMDHFEGITDHHLLTNRGIIAPMINNGFL